MGLGNETGTLGRVPLLELPRRVVHLGETVEVGRRAPEASQTIALPHVRRRVEVVSEDAPEATPTGTVLVDVGHVEAARRDVRDDDAELVVVRSAIAAVDVDRLARKRRPRPPFRSAADVGNPGDVIKERRADPGAVRPAVLGVVVREVAPRIRGVVDEAVPVVVDPVRALRRARLPHLALGGAGGTRRADARRVRGNVADVLRPDVRIAIRGEDAHLNAVRDAPFCELYVPAVRCSARDTACTEPGCDDRRT